MTIQDTDIIESSKKISYQSQHTKFRAASIGAFSAELLFLK